jgi:hypothetical protein
MTAQDAVAVCALVERCWGDTYVSPVFYDPARLAAEVASGHRIAEVVEAPDGTIVAHWGAVFITDDVVETGTALTDPTARHSGLISTLGVRLRRRLDELDVRGRIRQQVLTHPWSQHLALREGARVVGVHLASLAPVHEWAMPVEPAPVRTTVGVMFEALRPVAPATVWVPGWCREVVGVVLHHTGWPLTLGEPADVTTDTVRGRSDLRVDTDVHNTTTTVSVRAIGTDLVDVLTEVVHVADPDGAVLVHLPGRDPAVTALGDALADLRLVFGSLLPSDGVIGDALVLQRAPRGPLGESGWAFADPTMATIARLVLDQVRWSR